MNLWILVGIVAAVLYGLWLLLNLVFQMIDHAHEGWRESNRRDSGGEPVRERGD